MKNKIQSLIQQMTLEEKASLCSGLNLWQTKPIERLGIPSIWLSDGPHGLRKQAGSPGALGSANVPATCFPTAAAMASTWDRDLVRQVGSAVGEECQAEGVDVLLGPGANIKRTPLCGRNFEYFSEDPYLSSALATSFIAGVQSQGVGTSLKHFAANNQETDRMAVDAIIDERTLREIYLTSFEDPVKEGPWTVMCAYNRLNGAFCSENGRLLTDILRDDWGFEGVVVSDWGAVDARVAGLAAGLELEMPSSGGTNDRRIVAAVKSGELAEAVLDRAVERLLELIFKAANSRKPGATYDREAHHRLARRAAREAIVLLKNDQDLLPLPRCGTLAVLGALATQPKFQGGGSSHVNPNRLDEPLAELSRLGGKDLHLLHEPGYRLETGEMDQELLHWAMAAASRAERVVIFAGLPAAADSEGSDRPNLELPQNQRRLIEVVAAAHEHVAVVLMNGSPVTMPWLEQVEAVMVAHTGGQAVGGAIADVLFGEACPCGKLAETYPADLAHTPTSPTFPEDRRVEGTPVAEYREGIFVGYRYYDRKHIQPLFPFGFGLSYTTFTYTGMSLDKHGLRDDEMLTVSVTVRNSGLVAGKEIVQVYVRDLGSRVPRPEKELKGFAKLELAPGEERTVNITLGKRAFAYYDTDLKDWAVESGDFEILAGGSSQDLPLRKCVSVTSTTHWPRQFSRYSTIGELYADQVGAKLISPILQSFLAHMPASDSADLTASLGMDMLALFKGMPLRSLLSFAGEAFTEEMLDSMLEQLNKATQ